MQRIHNSLLLLAIIVSLVGCFETEQVFTLNPDGSGKVRIHSVSSLNMASMFATDLDPEKMMQQIVDDILKNSVGVEAWSDVSYKLTDDGKLDFTGTAYFKDISTLWIQDLPIINATFSPNDQGDLVLKLTSEKSVSDDLVTDQPPIKLTETQIAQRVKTAQEEFQQGRIILSGYFKPLNISALFHLPGKLKENTNFTPTI